MRTLTGLAGPVLLISVVLMGCDEIGSTGRVQSQVVLDLQRLQQVGSGDARQTCLWVAGELVVTADDQVQCREAVGPEDAQVRCPVEAEIGTVTFKAEILGNRNSALLFDGAMTTTVEQDGFEIGLSLRPRNPVMQYCEAPNQLTNRGTGTLNWSLTPLSNPCTLTFLNPSGTLAPGDSDVLRFRPLDTSPRACVVALQSPQGDLQVCMCSGCGVLLEEVCCAEVNRLNLGWSRCEGV